MDCDGVEGVVDGVEVVGVDGVAGADVVGFDGCVGVVELEVVGVVAVDPPLLPPPLLVEEDTVSCEVTETSWFVTGPVSSAGTTKELSEELDAVETVEDVPRSSLF